MVCEDLEDGNGIMNIREVKLDSDTGGEPNTLPLGIIVVRDAGCWHPPCYTVSHIKVVVY